MNFNALNTTPIGVIALAASGGEEVVGVASISAVASCSANSARYSGAEASVINSVSTATVTNVIRVARATASLSCSADANTSGYRAVFTPADILAQAQASTVALIVAQSSIHVTADGAVVAVGSRAAYDSAALMGQSDAIANSYAQQYVDTQAIDGTAAITAEAVKYIRFIATVSCSATVAAEAYTEVVMLGQIQANAQVTDDARILTPVFASASTDSAGYWTTEQWGWAPTPYYHSRLSYSLNNPAPSQYWIGSGHSYWQYPQTWPNAWRANSLSHTMTYHPGSVFVYHYRLEHYEITSPSVWVQTEWKPAATVTAIAYVSTTHHSVATVSAVAESTATSSIVATLFADISAATIVGANGYAERAVEADVAGHGVSLSVGHKVAIGYVSFAAAAQTTALAYGVSGSAEETISAQAEASAAGVMSANSSGYLWGQASLNVDAVADVFCAASLVCEASLAGLAYLESYTHATALAAAQVTEGTERLATVEATVDSFAQISANSYAERIGEADVAGHGVTISVGHKVAVGFNSITAAANITASSAVISSRVVSLEGAAQVTEGTERLAIVEATVDSFAQISANSYAERSGEADVAGYGVTISVGHKVAVGFNSITAAANTTASSAVISSRAVSLEGAANLSSNSLVIRSAQAQTDALSTVNAHTYLICFGEAPIVSSASVSAEAYTVTVVVAEPVAAALADASAYCDRLASASVSGNSVTISVGERQAISDTTISASAMVASTGINNAFTQANAQSLALVTADAGVGHAVSAAAHFMDYSVPIHVEEWRWIFEARWWRQYYNYSYSWNKNPWSGGNTSYPNFSDWPNVYSDVDHRVIDGPHYMTVGGTSYQYYKVETWVDYWETQYFWKGSPSANVTAIPSSVGFQLETDVDPLTAAANVTAEPVRIRLAPTQPINCFAVAVADGQYEAVESADIVCSATVSENTGVIVSVVANVDDGGYWTADEYDWRSVSTNWQTEPLTGSPDGYGPIYNGWEWFTSGYRLVLPHYTTSYQSNLGTLYHYDVEEYYLKTPSYFVVTDPSPSATVTAIAGQHAISWGEALLTDGYWETQTTWNEIPNAYYATYWGNYAPYNQSWYYKDGTEVNYSGTDHDLSVLPSGARVGTQLSVSGNSSTYHSFFSGGYTWYAPKWAVEEPTYTTVWVATGHNPSAEITANGSVLFVVEPFSVAATAAVSDNAIKIAVVSNVDLPAIADVPPIADDKIVVTHIVHVDPFSVDCSSTVVASSANLITLSLDTIAASAIVSVSAINLVSAVAEAIEEGYWVPDEYDWRLLGSSEIVVTDQSNGYGNVVQGSQYASNPAEYRKVIPHYLVVGGVYHYYRVEEYYLKTPSYWLVTDPSPSATVTATATHSALLRAEALLTEGYWETQTTWNDIPNAYYATYASGHESLTNSWYYENNVEIGRSYTGGDISILPSETRVGTQLSTSGNYSTYHTFFSGGYTYYAPKYAVEEPTYTTVWVATDNRPYAEVTAGCFVIVGNKPVTLTGSAVTTANSEHMISGGFVTLPATADVPVDDNKVITYHIVRVEPFSVGCTCLVDEDASIHTTLSLDTISASAAPTASAYCLRATTAVASASASVYPDAFSHSEAFSIAGADVSTNPHALCFTDFTVNATAEVALTSTVRLAWSSADVIAACVVDAAGLILSGATAQASAICQANTFVERFSEGYITGRGWFSGEEGCIAVAYANVINSVYAQCFTDAQIHSLANITVDLPSRLRFAQGHCFAGTQVHAEAYRNREVQAEAYCSANLYDSLEGSSEAHDLVCTADLNAYCHTTKDIFNTVINAASEIEISIVLSIQEGTRSDGIHILVEAEDRSVAVELINTALIIELEERVVYVEAA